MSQTVAQRLEEHAAGLVGRVNEREILHSLLAPNGPVVIFVHGIAGVGKTALAEAFALEARGAGATVLRLDSRAIEPTERGFLAALADATGSELATVNEAAGRLEQLGMPLVIVVDTYEVLRLFDPWLRETFVPALRDNVRLLLCGREAPMTGWSGAFGSLFRSLPLGRLPREDAEALLHRAGVAREDAERINHLARGHPLSLQLAASALTARPEITLEAVTVQTIVDELTELYLDGLDPSTRRALDAASVVRRPTLSLLAAMLPEAAPQDAFDRLRRLPFVELSDDGPILHDTVREAVAAHLDASDPDRSRRYRAAAWRRLREEVVRASRLEMWRYTADLLYMLRNPMICARGFSRPPNTSTTSSGTAHGWARHHRDRAATRASRNGGDLRGLVATGAHFVPCCPGPHWRDRRGDHLLRDGRPEPPPARCRSDRARLFEHRRRQNVFRAQRVLFNRGWIARDTGEAPSAVQAAMWLDYKRSHMEMRPDLRGIYGALRDVATFGPSFAAVGFVPLEGGPIEIDGVPYYTAVNDFGPASIDGWLSRLIAAELQIDDDGILDVDQHQLVLDGPHVDLTKLEFDVIHYLYQRPGRIVKRGTLPRDVWGYEDSGGSNVIEALVGSLRRKLGDRASAIETVRGQGYRSPRRRER